VQYWSSSYVVSVPEVLGWFGLFDGVISYRKVMRSAFGLRCVVLCCAGTAVLILYCGGCSIGPDPWPYVLPSTSLVTMVSLRGAAWLWDLWAPAKRDP
jgi:hypothetical protein